MSSHGIVKRLVTVVKLNVILGRNGSPSTFLSVWELTLGLSGIWARSNVWQELNLDVYARLLRGGPPQFSYILRWFKTRRSQYRSFLWQEWKTRSLHDSQISWQWFSFHSPRAYRAITSNGRVRETHKTSSKRSPNGLNATELSLFNVLKPRVWEVLLFLSRNWSHISSPESQTWKEAKWVKWGKIIQEEFNLRETVLELCRP